jgi:hypothetical protein
MDPLWHFNLLWDHCCRIKRTYFISESFASVKYMIVPTLLSIYAWLYSPSRPWQLFEFLNLYTVGKAASTGDQPVARPLTTHRTTQTQNKRTQTSMSPVGFKPTIPVFKRAKAVHASDARPLRLVQIIIKHGILVSTTTKTVAIRILRTIRG